MNNGVERTKTELMPCPFCGGEAQLEWPHEGGAYIRHDCDFVTGCWYETEAEAIEAWNTRAHGTCEVEGYDDGVDEGMDGEWYSYGPPTWYLSCGHETYGSERPCYCSTCGRKVDG